MMLQSLELNTTSQSNAAVQKLVNGWTKEIKSQEYLATVKETKKHNPLALGKIYIRILESGGHLGC
ncbi:hypothetical protein QUB13_06405 [Microcoleus sp. B4-D4]